MITLEEIKKGAQIKGLDPDQLATIVAANFIGEHALEVVYKTEQGALREQILYRSNESQLEVATAGRAWAFDAPAADFKLGLEATRISLAHLFDPMMAVHTSNVEPLPHQITAVYEAMLPRQPLRYVLADDPGAGKTIMAGLFLRELILRADAYRVLVVCPGSLTEQWQDELLEKFGLEFQIFSREKQEQSISGNYFEEQPRLLARLDQLSRNEDYKAKIAAASDWDIIIVDEAHKMSASYYGQKVDETQRFKLGKLLGQKCRHFLLMTATPHNGKEENFQLFMSLLDEDRFYGKFREGVHKVDVSDMMRRMVKEDLLKFDGTPLFPERIAYTAKFQLSALEQALYQAVTEYVRLEMNRADRLDNQRKSNIGFALTMLQRRLASSPEAIYQSLKRRRKRLETRVEEEKREANGSIVAETLVPYGRSPKRTPQIPDNPDEWEDELTASEWEAAQDEFTDGSTASQNIEELQAEIATLKVLERQAHEVVQSHNDRKWDELSKLLQDKPEMYNAAGDRRKLIIFTEHKDTLNYLQVRITGLLGGQEAVAVIHGGVPRDERRKIQELFWNDKRLLVLLATDAAGEGINLQNANLMVNYDLPWNPNRLEQRFGRIHRIGQTEVCHLWNLVATGTREGEVFDRLFEKLEVERQALGGRVFDILGEAFEDTPLRTLLIEAIRYGELPETKAKMNQVIKEALDRERLQEIVKRNALAEEHMSAADL